MAQSECYKTRIFKLDPAPVTGQSGAESKVKCPKKKKHALNYHIPTKKTISLPKGLVGAKCTAPVTIDNCPCSSLLDTGSQVTTLSKSFYEENLSHSAIHSLDDLLEVEGANGQSLPYLGFIKTVITFPRSSLGADIEVPTLALIVPNLSSNSPSLLIGTNTLDVLYAQYGLAVDPVDKHFLPYGYKVLLQTLAARKKDTLDSNLGEVRLKSTDSETIQPRETKVLEGLIACRVQSIGKWVTVEAPVTAFLPGGLFVKDGLATLPSKLPQEVLVI